MGKKASIQHDTMLEFYMQTARKLGRRVIDLNDKSPDAIEIYYEKGKIHVNVIEIMHRTGNNDKKLSSQSRLKKDLYSNLGFDEVKIYEYSSSGPTDKKSLKRIPFNDDFTHTCRQCGEGFNDISKYQSHIFHKHTSKDPEKMARIEGKK